MLSSLILPSMLMFFLSLCRSKFLTWIIFPLSKELLSTFLAQQVYQEQILSFWLSEKVFVSPSLLKKKKKFIYLFLAVLGLSCCTQAFSSCGERGLLFVAVCGLLTAVASLVAEHGLQARRLQQLWHAGSVVVAHRLQNVGSVVVVHGLSCSVACGIFPDQGSNLCSPHWQADS